MVKMAMFTQGMISFVTFTVIHVIFIILNPHSTNGAEIFQASNGCANLFHINFYLIHFDFL